MRIHSALPVARRGFTLIETALAVVIVAIVLLAAIGLLIPAQRAIDDVLTADQATRLLNEIEKEMAVVRPNETANFTTGFDKAYRAANQHAAEDGVLAVFFYRAQKPTAGGGTGGRTDGRLAPFTGDIVTSRAGDDYVLQAAVMPVAAYNNDIALKDALDGGLFLARLVPLEGLLPETSEQYLKNNPDPNGYPEAVIPAAVEFYVADDLDDPSRTIPSILNGSRKPLMSLNAGFNR